MAPDIRDQLQTTLSGSYTLERELGGGGMSRVFVATETSLQRKVVVKVLPPELAAGVSVERFKREIQLAAALLQAHIVPVLSAGDTDGLPYYTMPFVEGESLRAKIAKGPLTITESVGILRDVAKALAYAHDRGVVHRDIKPDNVLLSGGSAVVTDFGIAKAISAAKTNAPGATLTMVGTSIGTPVYMAPEQAAGDPDTDHRADIYAWGVMGYELLTGRPPFHGLTPHKLLAAHMGETPAPISSHRGDIPAPLADLVMRCLSKEPHARPQQASELVRVLENVTSGTSMPAMSPLLFGGKGMLVKALAVYAVAFAFIGILAKAAIVGIGLPDWVLPGSLIVMLLGLPVILFTAYAQRMAWRAATVTPTLTPGGTPSLPMGTVATMAVKVSPHMSWKKTAWGGIYALATFVVLISAFMIMRSLGIGPAASLLASGKLDKQDRLLIADFKAIGDTTLGPVVAEAVRADLAQSNVITLFSPGQVAAALGRMQKARDTRLTSDLAQELAQREGVKAIVDGTVQTLGAGFIVSLRLVGADSGQALASFQGTANSPADLIPTIGKVSRELRAKMGESLRKVQGGQRLEEVTTTSLPALKKYTEGLHALNVESDFTTGARLLEEAIHLDTGFAMAYRRLGVELNNRGGQEDRVAELLTKSYEHRDRLSEVERQMATGSFLQSGPLATRDARGSIAAYEAVLAINPDYGPALNNAALLYARLHEFDRAVALLRRAIALPGASYNYFSNLLGGMEVEGRYATADSLLAALVARYPSNPLNEFNRADIAQSRGNYEGANRILRAALPAVQPNAAVREAYQFVISGMELAQGHLREGMRWDSLANASAGERGALRTDVAAALDRAALAAWTVGDLPGSARIVDSLERSGALSRFTGASMPYDLLGSTYAATGQPAKVRALVALKRKTLGSSHDTITIAPRYMVEAYQALAEKRYADAARNFNAANIGDGNCMTCVLPFLGVSLDRAGMADSAIKVFESYANAFNHPAYDVAYFMPPVLMRLGELYEAKGNRDKAAEYYSRYVTLYKTADPELQPRVNDVQKRIARLRIGKG
ncbi:MAG: hypothetical protein JWO05_2143 [Gemmatimonadetes bacterium]|nr:hypothetical protein [Gemmatimonadota bacterium]